MKVKQTDMVMIDPMAPYRASLMPDHLNNKSIDGKTSRYFKHGNRIAMAVDYGTISLLGRPMTRQQMVDKFANFIRHSPGYGRKGGSDYAPNQANRHFCGMLKEGLIVKL